MRIPENVMEKKPASDVETAAQQESGDNAMPGSNILDPLLFLLAGRRGVRSDSHFAATNIPDDQAIIFVGPSGVEAINHTPLWKRLLCGVGCMDSRWGIVCIVFTLTNSLLAHFDSPPESTNETEWKEIRFFSRHVKIATVVALCLASFFIWARRYAKRQAAAATPPQFDPASYQSRLAHAMTQRGIHYREIAPVTLIDMERHRKSEKRLVERFQIEGLVDPMESSWVYDIVVRFYSKGNVFLQFASADNTPGKKPGLILTPNVESL
ncbi:hypothetical protein N7474_007767 [Penicillium riverlandense]|uniref:uncharacterized protein n=1 Tax=Penicillium riverlandense TaxID=1903569 RepID=UPI00254765FA|nr:uncharacterized protein N7474_007767 [Penicillium riverlandense]KAJ5811466.1 hypothetical protein N7474_007767 [Penicillium riverlandense]